jgi:hypothetical protein
MTDQAVAQLAGRIGVRDACVAVSASQAGYYRRHRVSPPPERPAPIPHRQRRQPRALSAQEQQAILDVLHSDRFVDMSPAEVWATLLDEGVYLGSQSTFYIGALFLSRRHRTPVAKSVGFFGDVFPLGVFGESGGLGIAHPGQPLGVDGEMQWRLVDSGDIGDGAHGLGDVAEVCVVEDGLHPGVGIVVGVDALSGRDVVEEFCHVAGGLDERDFDAKWLAFHLEAFDETAHGRLG